MNPTPATFLRLRQVCLVAQQLDPVVDVLCDVLGLQVCHRDAGVERFGLHNALMRIGSSFIEVVAPLPGLRGANSAATRHLARMGGDGGYMVILDTDAIAPWRTHAAALGIREASFHQVSGYTGLQLHPRDTGGTLLEINHSEGNSDLHGPYWPAGPHWQQAPDSTACVALRGAILSDSQAEVLAQRWAALLQRPVSRSDENAAQHMTLDNRATLVFNSVPAQSRQGLTGLQLAVQGEEAVQGIVQRAQTRGLPVRVPANAVVEVEIGGVAWLLKTG